MSQTTLHELEDHLLLFFTGFSRSASDILKDQDTRTKQADTSMVDNLHYVKELGYRSKQALESDQPAAFGEIMHEHWEHKRKRSSGMSQPADRRVVRARPQGRRDRRQARRRGRRRLPDVLRARADARCAPRWSGAGLEEVRFRFDFDGTRVVFS